jgi:tripartite-type tricarboxylate transporter receptor subunit TctC
MKRIIPFLLFAALALSQMPTHAQSNKTIRILVGFPAGGGTDVIARHLAERLKDELKTNVIVENRAGAGGQLAAQALKMASGDGSVFFLSHDHTISIIPLTVKSPGFDPTKDFVPVAGFASFVNAWALSSTTPAKTLTEYIDFVKAAADVKVLAVGVPALASAPEFLVGAVAARFSRNLVKPLVLTPTPYRGSAPMIADMLGQQIMAGTGSVPDFIEQHKAGKLRVVAVMGNDRQPALPDVPTLKELGVSGFEAVPYYGVWANATAPKADVEAFASAIQRVLAQPELVNKLTALGLNVQYSTGSQLAQRERAYSAAWGKVIEERGF